MMDHQKIQADVITWALPEGAIARLGQGRPSGLTFSMDESTLAVWSLLGVWLYDVSTLTPIDLLATERGWITHVAFSPNDALIAIGNQDGDVKVWDRHSQRYVSKMERMGENNRATRLVFSPDGQLLASSGGRYDGVYVWHHESGEQVAAFTVDDSTKPRFRPSYIPLSFSPDGRLLAGATPEHTISIWDIETKERIACLKEHAAPVAELIFSPCGQFLTSADINGILYEWDVHKNAERAFPVSFSELPTYATGVPKLAYFTDGTFIAAGNHERTVTLWEPKRGNKLRTLRSERCPDPLCFSPQTLQLALGGKDEVQFWDIGETSPRKQSLSIREYLSVCGAVTFSPDGAILAAGHWDGRIRLWDVESLKRLKTFGTGNASGRLSLDFSPCGKHLASGSKDTAIRIWDIENVDVPLAEFKESDKEDKRSAGLWHVAFLPRGDALVCAKSNGHLSVWDGGKKRTALPVGTNRIDFLSVSPDGKQIAVVDFNGRQAELYDVENGQLLVNLCLVRVEDHAKYRGDTRRLQGTFRRLEKPVERPSNRQIVGPIIFSPCGTVIAGGLLGEIRIWDATTYEVRMVILPPQGCNVVGALTFSPCGKYLVSGAWWRYTDQMGIRLWEVATGENIATFWGHSTDVQDLAFSPDGTLLASGSFDGTLLLWDMKPYV